MIKRLLHTDSVFRYGLVLGMFCCVACTTNETKKPFFKALDPASIGINYEAGIENSDSLNILTYPYLFNGAGLAAGDIDQDGLPDLFIAGNPRGTSKLYRNLGNFQFEDITAKAGISDSSDWNTGVTMIDINGDGLLDIYQCSVTIPGRLQSRNQLYVNQGNGKFREEAAAYGLDFADHSTQAAFFDKDNDGDLDCYLLNHPVSYAEEYGTVSDRGRVDSLSGDKLLQNDNGHFTDVSATAGIYRGKTGYGLGISTADFNNDGWTDIYVGNDFKENDFCYINNGDGTFTESAASLFSHVSRFSMGNDVADINNDGWQDLMSLDMLSNDEKVRKSSVSDEDIETYDYKNHFGFHYQLSRNCLQLNHAGKYFTDVALLRGVAATDWSWGPLFADFNNDGFKDLFIANGFSFRVNDLDFNLYAQTALLAKSRSGDQLQKTALLKEIPDGAVADYFFLNESGRRFSDQSANAGFTEPTHSSAALYCDLDRDGKLDLLVNHVNAAPGIYRNEFDAGRSIHFMLKGNGSNTQGLGAKLYLYADSLFQYYEYSGSRGFMTGIADGIVAGLGNRDLVDTVKILWPSGMQQSIYNVPVDTVLVLKEADALDPAVQRTLTEAGFSEETSRIQPAFLHREDDFNDYNNEPLLPHSEAAWGPALAKADIDGDGKEDFFVGAAKGQKAAIYRQQQNGFQLIPCVALDGDSICEDNGALFFDADNDGDADLLVTSGGNEFFGSNSALRDRLYLNNGNGQFEKSKTFPALYENTGTVAASDFDKDGDLDLFIGGRSNARIYGYDPASVLLLNDGKGNFTEATEKIAPGLQHAGMITGACFADIDQDQWPDLVLVGEWMPLTIYLNKKGNFQKLSSPELDQQKGWWNCILPADLDQDGDIDFILGNWGLNTKLRPDRGHPLRLYLADWDGSGNPHPILALPQGSSYYPFYGKTELEKRIPVIRKTYPHYADMAGKTIEEIFGAERVKEARSFEATTLASSICWNEGKGYRFEELPDELQQAPLLALTSLPDRPNQYLAAGNFFQVAPFEGRYDALLPTVFEIKDHNIKIMAQLPLHSAFRGALPLSVKDEPFIVLAANNDRLRLIRLKNEKQ